MLSTEGQDIYPGAKCLSCRRPHDGLGEWFTRIGAGVGRKTGRLEGVVCPVCANDEVRGSSAIMSALIDTAQSTFKRGRIQPVFKEYEKAEVPFYGHTTNY